MKKFSLTALIAGAVLFVSMGATSLSAEAMKCGAGKCGAAMEKPACCKTPATELKKPACCEAKAAGKACQCDANVKCSCKDKTNCICPAGKKAPKAAMKCGPGKCGGSMAKPAPKEAMKCGTGKCG
ncbi:MAG: hypothetical protein ACI9TV_000767 [Sulfurimonas sp.]|jgi:hypothetical protein|uniref:HvfA family oxazolone/thioamide-modified RiPP metallophore n=1 Tax=Sulfurimonas sp. TaxID=2022749 RepID=UPI0039E706B4